MEFGILEDYTISGLDLGEDLVNPTSGLFLNDGVSPLITVKNLLNFLPYLDYLIPEWDNLKNYELYDSDIKGLVSYNSKFYICKESNVGLQPDLNPISWAETNKESVVLMNFVKNVVDRALLSLSIENVISEKNIVDVTKSSDYDFSLISDYVGLSFNLLDDFNTYLNIKKLSIQANTINPIDVYVVNNGVLLQTIQLTPENGLISFKDVDLKLKGFGTFYLVMESSSVKKGTGYLDKYNFDGVVVSGVLGKGNSPESSEFSENPSTNGFGVVYSVEMDIKDSYKTKPTTFFNYIKSCFEYSCFELFLYNPNATSNQHQKVIMDKNLLQNELKILDADTVAKRRNDYKKQLEDVLSSMFKVKKTKGFTYKLTSI